MIEAIFPAGVSYLRRFRCRRRQPTHSRMGNSEEFALLRRRAGGAVVDCKFLKCHRNSCATIPYYPCPYTGGVEFRPLNTPSESYSNEQASLAALIGGKKNMTMHWKFALSKLCVWNVEALPKSTTGSYHFSLDRLLNVEVIRQVGLNWLAQLSLLRWTTA